VNLRARTGREQVNSQLSECSLTPFAVERDVFALHNPNICLKAIGVAIAPGSSADVVCQHSHAFEIGDRARLHIKALQGDERKGKGDRLQAGEQLVDEDVRREFGPARDGFWLGQRWWEMFCWMQEIEAGFARFRPAEGCRRYQRRLLQPCRVETSAAHCALLRACKNVSWSFPPSDFWFGQLLFAIEVLSNNSLLNLDELGDSPTTLPHARSYLPASSIHKDCQNFLFEARSLAEPLFISVS
jgi:hypothetical protein